MSRRHAIQLVPVVLMHPAQQDIDVRINDGRLLNDVLHAGMRATNNQNHSLWTLDGQRQLLQLQSARRCGDASEDKYSGSNFSPLVDRDEIGARPRRSAFEDLRRMAAIVAHVSGQRWVFAV